jgi:hypothetical protein
MSIQDLDEKGTALITEATDSAINIPGGVCNASSSPDVGNPSSTTLSVQSAQPEVTSTQLAPSNDIAIANSKICGVCQGKEGIYKCSRCYLR